MKRKTKIIATVGPSVDSKNKIHELIDSGADVIRLNFSHGSHEDHKNIVDWVRDYPKSIAIMQDIQGS
jgi:pyruvate kinase